MSWNFYRLSDDRGDLCGAVVLAFELAGDGSDGEPNTDIKQYVMDALAKSKA